MENGDSLNVGYNHNTGQNPIQNGSFFLPAPGDSTRCYFLYMYPAYYQGMGIFEIKLHYALIDMTANNGLGKVLEKNVPILTGDMDVNFNHAGAVRHANGRDWWILVPNRNEPKYYRILLTPDGFSTPEVQEIGFNNDPKQWLGYNLFSPDGTKYAVFDYIQHISSFPELTGLLQFYDFDRCTGLLSNPVLIDVPPSNPMGEMSYVDIVFSPSGKRFYLCYGNSTGTYVAQCDLNASNIQNSWQIILACPPGSNYDCQIAKALLAPNGKIYVTSIYDTVAFHVIHQPDSLGTACELELGGLVFPGKLPQTELSYFPNYRLYDLPGSTCDTLGIDAPPPPPSATEEGMVPAEAPIVSVFPNPAQSATNFRIGEGYLPRLAMLTLRTTTGQVVRTQRLMPGWSVVGLEGIAPGLYFWEVKEAGVQVLGTGKLIVVQ
ncbi:MAG: hypothetical protein IT258_11265 [Saprospiraceae bacterium]|nr:hypothetical protein [Saprospiraceae bacterium]